MGKDEQSRAQITGDANVLGRGNIVQSVKAESGSTIQDVVQQVFVGDYERLGNAYIPPPPLFERVNLDHFVGRKWLLEKVDTFLRGHDRGYFILEAEAGLGKTTFLAHLVKERPYLHHFVEQAPGEGGIAIGLRNLAAQLILAWQLEDEVGYALSAAASRPDYLQNLLFRAASKRDEVRPKEMIVLVVDALDEAGTPSSQNVLGLPQVLPEGVFIIASQRPVPVTLHVDTASTSRRSLTLAAGSDENQADMRLFLERAAAWPGVTQALRESGYSAEQFTTTLLEKCRGIWIYLHFVVHEIERGERSPLDLETLPDGMAQYYARYWKRWRDEDEDKWYAVYLPLLSTLAAVQEAVIAERLAEWADVKLPLPQVCHLLNERWRPFLARTGQGEDTRYRLYHATLHEFFEGKVDQDDPKLAAELAFIDELVTATHQAHNRLAERYLSAWGGFGDGLPGLRDPAVRDLDDRYGLRYLAAHMESAGRIDDLHRLLRAEWRRPKKKLYAPLRPWRLLGRLSCRRLTQFENAWYVAHEQANDTSGYLNDVTRGWRLAAEASASEIEGGQPAASVGLGIRYALLTASVNSITANISPALLVTLVENGIWSPAQGLAYAQRMPDPRKRPWAVARLGPYLSESLLWEAMAIARTFENESIRGGLLAALMPHLCSESLLQEALAATRAMESDWPKVRALAVLAPYLPVPLLTEALATARAIEHEYWRGQALAELVPRLPEPLLTEALTAAWAIEKKYSRAMALVGLAPHLQEPLKGKVLTEALATARTIDYEKARALAFTKLVTHLAEPLRAEVLKEALTAAQAIKNEKDRAKALAELAPYLLEPSKGEVLKEALAVARTIEFKMDRAIVLTEVSQRLVESGYPREALMVAWEMESGYWRREALKCIAPHLPRPLLWEALAAIEGTEDENERARLLASLAPQLSGRLLVEALMAAQAIDEITRIEALKELAPRLAELGYPKEALAIVKAIRDFFNSEEALERLSIRLAELGHLEDALAAARAIPNWHGGPADALAGVAPHLPQPLRGEVLQEVLAKKRAIRDTDDRTLALVSLAPHLSKSLLKEALVAAREIRVEDDRAEALIGLVPYLPEPVKSKVSDKALAAARAIRLSEDRTKALATIASHLPEPLRSQVLQEALAAAGAVEKAKNRVKVLAELVPHLPEPLRGEALRKSLAAAQAVENENEGTQVIEVLACIVPHLPEPLREEALSTVLAAVKAVESDWKRELAWEEILVELVSQLVEANYSPERILVAVRGIRDREKRATALAQLTPHLSEAEREQALREALRGAGELEIERSRAEVLARLAPYLAQWANRDSLAACAAWQETLPILARRTRPDLLSDLRALSSLIAALGGEEAIAETFRAVQDVGRWWP
jgi:hypothetical protein